MNRRVAILIDGGFFLKRLNSVKPFPQDKSKAVEHVLQCLDWLVSGHLKKLNETYCLPSPWAMLYRVFYYDAHPHKNQEQLPVSKRSINYATTDEAVFRENLFEALRGKRKYALRLGHVYREHGWMLHDKPLKQLLRGERTVENLTDEDFRLGLRQKGVDMRLGMDVAALTLKRQADTVVLVTGDTDFISVAKLARREGVEIVLDPMWWNVSSDLLEHVDGIWQGIYRGTTEKTADEH